METPPRSQFDQSLHQGRIAGYFRNIRAVVLITLTFALAGLVMFLSLPRELNPEIEIPIVMVTTSYPGAGPQDIESLVTEPIENAVEGLSGVSSLTSTSQESFSTVVLEFSSSTDPQEAKADVQSAVDGIGNLPTDADSPRVNVFDFENQPVMTFSLSSSGDPASLSEFSRILEERLKDLPAVKSATRSYHRPEEVSIVLRPAQIAARGLDLRTVGAAVEASLTSAPGGSLRSGDATFSLSAERQAWSVADLRALPIAVGDSVISLGELATIEERPVLNATDAFYATPDTAPAYAVSFSVLKTDGADAQETAAGIFETFAALNAEHGGRYALTPLFDGAEEIKKSFDQLFHDFLLTIGLVFLLLIVFFGVRQSVVASLAIPLAFLGTFLVMGATGISINFIALFSLLLALGILVDNAIVIISAMARYERQGGFSPQESALLVWRDFSTVIFTTTITTIWAFFPLVLAGGIIGEFIRPIPIVVSSALAISAAIALFIVTPMMAALQHGQYPKRVRILFLSIFFLGVIGLLAALISEGPYRIALVTGAAILWAFLFWVGRLIGKTGEVADASLRRRMAAYADRGVFDFHPLAEAYKRFIRQVLETKAGRRRTLAMLIILMLFAYALFPLGFVKNEFFPEVDQENVNVSVELPQGTAPQESQRRATELLETLRHEEGVRYILAEVGGDNIYDEAGAGGPDSILLSIKIVPADERGYTSGAFVSRLNAKYGSYPHGTFTASQPSGGPPAGADLQIKLLGEDMAELERYAKKTEAFLESQDGIASASISDESGSSKIVFVPDERALADLGVSMDEIGFWLRTLGNGYTVKEDVRFEEGAERDIVIRLQPADGYAEPEALSALLIPIRGKNVPLLQLGRFELASNPSAINREDGKRTLSVSADVAEGYAIPERNAVLESFADGELGLAEGYEWKTGGVNEENEKSIQSILWAMLLSAALIFGTMVIQFNSFRKALIVLLVIPLAVTGVFIIFALTGTALSFPALIGILALFGIVVNNSIIMVDKINKNMDLGIPLDDAIAEGAASRLEPILLTALATIVGLIPITLSDPLWQGLGGAIISGLLFSGVAKLFFIPVAYKLFFPDDAKDRGVT